MKKMLRRAVEWTQDNLDPRECTYSPLCLNCFLRTVGIVVLISLLLASLKG